MCSIPTRWRVLGNVNRIQLAERSGILQYVEDLSVNEVMTCFDVHPELIEGWQTDVDDIRGPGVWAFGKHGKGYQLGKVAEDMSFKKTKNFPDLSETCAVFAMLCTASYLDCRIEAANRALKGNPIRSKPQTPAQRQGS